MGFKLGVATGFAAGYYMGTKAGRRRYEQINRMVSRVRRTRAVEKARSLVDERLPGANGYSSSR